MWLRFIFTTVIFTIVVLKVVEGENENFDGIVLKKSVVQIIDQNNEKKVENLGGQSTPVQKPQIVVQVQVEEDESDEDNDDENDDDRPPWLRHPVEEEDQEDESDEEDDDEDFIPKKRKKIPGIPFIREIVKVTRRKKIGVKNPEIRESIVPGYVTNYGEVLVPLDTVSNGNGPEQSVSVIKEQAIGLDGEGTWKRKKKNRLKNRDQEKYEVPYPLQYYVEENYFKKRGKDKFGYVGSEVPYPLAYYIGQHKRHYIRKWHSGYKIPSSLFLRSGLRIPTTELENEPNSYFSNGRFDSPFQTLSPQFYSPNPYSYYEIEEDDSESERHPLYYYA